MKSILDPTFRYTSSVQTDLRKTFARIRRAQNTRERARTEATAESTANILPIQKCAAGGGDSALPDRR